MNYAANDNNTKVIRNGNVRAGRLRQLEGNLPAWRGNLTLNHDEGNWSSPAYQPFAPAGFNQSGGMV
ncbi:MAG: hypothetical protein COA84_12280 [Robiginitomaculum sp.]|nr:MAG: hypothetical protein COA84_12280 [Robiginitomaculum sp.]